MAEPTWIFFQKNENIYKYKLIDNAYLFDANLMQLQIEGWNEELTFNDITHIRTVDYLKESIESLPNELKELDIKRTNINVIPTFTDKIRHVKMIDSKIQITDEANSSVKQLYPNAKIEIYDTGNMFKTDYDRKVYNNRRPVVNNFVPNHGAMIINPPIIDDMKNVLNSTQTVHLSSINKCIIDAIELIKKDSLKYDNVIDPIEKLLSVMNINTDSPISYIVSQLRINFFNNLISNRVINEIVNKYVNFNKYSKLKTNLNHWYNDGVRHSVFQLTFKELFDMVMRIIESHPEKNNIKELLITELYDAIGVCFLGRINRMINSLSPFVDGIKISISVKEEVQIKIGIIIKKLMENKIKKKDAIIEMKELFSDVGEKDNITDEFKKANLEALNDFDDDDTIEEEPKNKIKDEVENEENYEAEAENNIEDVADNEAKVEEGIDNIGDEELFVNMQNIVTYSPFNNEQLFVNNNYQ
jgi:hypothetical protein